MNGIKNAVIKLLDSILLEAEDGHLSHQRPKEGGNGKEGVHVSEWSGESKARSRECLCVCVCVSLVIVSVYLSVFGDCVSVCVCVRVCV